MAKEDFLKRHEDWENELKMNGHVIINEKDYEAILSALSFGRIREMDGVLYSKTNFALEIGQKVEQIKPKDFPDDQEFIPIAGIIIGRVEWDSYENDYLIFPTSNWTKEDKFAQLAESQIKKVKV